ncbi:MAG: RHS repeat-associated core domain-containing protein, partial [Planctomycetes bacterium]|nr:RHS repeat-associated core domain-containing protein [Planctomycetota bacterium]
AVVEQYEYDPYGKVTVYDGSGSLVGDGSVSGVGLPFLWKGIRLDSETGLLYMRNRYYSTAMGRFLTRDPIDAWIDGANAGNQMCYAGNSPMVRSDPHGLLSVSGDPQTCTYDQMRWQARLLRLFWGVSAAQEVWICQEMKRGCIGVVSAVAGVRVRGRNCWDTKEQAEKEAARLAKGGACDPVTYSIQLHNDTGSDGVNPDVSINPDTGQANLENWDGQNPNGTNCNFGVQVGPDTMMYADNVHNVDSDRDGVGDLQADAPIMEMTVYKDSVDGFNGVARGLFNTQVWCVPCRGNFQ